MRKKILIFTLIMLFLLPALYSPENPTLSVDAPAIGNSLQVQEDFVISADGDVSTESIGESYSQKWRETLDSDTMLYPDRLQPDGASELTSYEICDNFVDTSNFAIATDTTDNSEFSSDGDLLLLGAECTTSQTGLIKIKWTLGASYGANGWNVLVRYRFNTTSESAKWQGYISFDSGVGSIFFTETTDWTVSTTSLTGSTTAVNIVLQFLGSNPTVSVGLFVDWFIVTGETAIPDYNDGEGDTYEENFAGVSDWGEYGSTWESGEAITTDGDVGTFTCEGDSANDFDGMSVSGLSLSTVTVFEIRYKMNSTAADMWQIYPLWSGGNAIFSLTESTSWRTEVIGVNDWNIPLVYPITEILVYGRCDADVDVEIDIECIGFGPADEMGWQHDGSTTAGIIGGNGGTLSTDGDLLTCIDDGDGSIYDFYIDTTATKACLEPNYYPFVELKFSTGNSYFRLDSYDQNDAPATIASYTEQGSTILYRYNLDAVENDNTKFIRLTSYSGYDLVVDYLVIYSIANNSITQSGVTTDDYLYVDSGTLYSHVDSGYIEANHDPALSVSDTYPVYNLTTSGTAPEFSQYVSSWSSYSDNTRGATTSGTITDIKLKFNSTEIISEIKFIEDGTAPIISDFWTVPYTPDEESDVTLAIYETDVGAGTYTVTFNAVDYPSGFNDVDLEATESSNHGGLWSYTIDDDDLPAGYYAFEVTASDGVNSATDLAIFRVTSIYLQITDIVLITATDTLAQISGHSNKDCNYAIYENDTLQGSGSVSEGWFSVSWTKDSTAGAYIELGIKFSVSTYTDWINGSYSVASAEVLHITDTDTSESTSEVQLSGYASLSCNYYVYSNDTYQSVTGSLTSGSFAVTFDKLTTIALHRWAVKFNDSSTTRWVNGSYDVLVTTMDIDIEAWGVETNTIEITGISNIAMTWYVYNEGVYSTENGAETAEIGFHFDFVKNTTVGKHNFSIYFNDTTDGTQSRWFNRSYTISTVYGESTIKAYFSSGIGIEDIEDKFKIYINGTRSSNSFYGDTSGIYEICIKDFFDNEIYNSSHAWSAFIDIEFDYHTLKIYSQIQNDPIYFVLTRGGTTISEYIGIGEILRYYVAAGTYTYTFTQGGQIYTDDLILSDDSYYTVTDLDLWDIMNKPDNAGGGTDIYSILSWYGIVGVFMLIFIGQIPNISKFIWSLFTRPKKPKKRMG